MVTTLKPSITRLGWVCYARWKQREVPSHIAFTLIFLPQLAVAVSPDEAMMAFTATLPSSKRGMTKNATATETLVKGIYAIWSRLDDERDVILVNENATILA